jgi:hypothetical protein
MLLMVQSESTVITEEEHGPGPKLPDPCHVKIKKLPVPPNAVNSSVKIES